MIETTGPTPTPAEVDALGRVALAERARIDARQAAADWLRLRARHHMAQAQAEARWARKRLFLARADELDTAAADIEAGRHEP